MTAAVLVLLHARLRPQVTRQRRCVHLLLLTRVCITDYVGSVVVHSLQLTACFLSQFRVSRDGGVAAVVRIVLDDRE